MKKLMTIIMLMTAMVMTGGAATYDFSQNGADTAWSNTANWSDGKLPTAADNVQVLGDGAWKPAEISAPGAVVNTMFLGTYGHGGRLTVGASGTLTLDGYLRIGTTAPGTGKSNYLVNHGQITHNNYDFRAEDGETFIENTGKISARNMVLSMNGGTTTFTNSGDLTVSLVLRLAQVGNTVFTMEGGTANVGTLDLAEAGTGHLNLYGGTINAASAELDGNERHTIDITEGQLIIGGDRTNGLDWMASIGRITAYGGTGTVGSEYDSGANKTTLYAVIPEPATLGLVTAFGGAVLFIRRRFMM